MSTSGIDYFLKLEVSDVKSKLTQLINEKVSLLVWDDSDRHQHTQIHEFSDKVLKIDGLDLDGQKFVYLTFSLQGMKYYFRAKVITTNEIEVEDYIYRAEKRKTMRYMMYPKVKALVSFSLAVREDQEDKNILSINTYNADIRENKVFKDFESSSDEIVASKNCYVLDLSEVGLAFLCPNKLSVELLTNKPKQATLVVEGENFTLENIEFVHDKEVKKSRVEDIYQKKIGIKFSECKGLEELLKKYDDGSMLATTVDESFQKFVNKSEEYA